MLLGVRISNRISIRAEASGAPLSSMRVCPVFSRLHAGFGCSQEVRDFQTIVKVYLFQGTEPGHRAPNAPQAHLNK